MEGPIVNGKSALERLAATNPTKPVSALDAIKDSSSLQKKATVPESTAKALEALKKRPADELQEIEAVPDNLSTQPIDVDAVENAAALKAYDNFEAKLDAIIKEEKK